MGWAFREFIHKIGIGINPDPPCSVGMDVAFVLDYTGSMGGVIDTVKAAVGDIVTAIDAEVGAGNYRLGLVISDEYTSTTPNYATSPDYISLPAGQKNINTGLGGKYQHNTAMALFDTNNDAFFTTQLNLLNTPLPGFPLGNGQNTPEPTDMAIDLVINSGFLNPFRINVAKYILLFTDATPGGNDDTYNATDDAKVAALTADCIAAGIKVIVIGAGASQTVWQDLATNTGGAYNTSYDSEVIISQIVASCQELEPPVANAGIDQQIQLPTNSVNVDGSGSTDSDGIITTYLWEQISGGAATITTPNSSITSITGLEWGPYVFRLTVTDDDTLQDTDFISIQVDPEAAISFSTTSVLASWQANTVTNTGSTLTWDLTNGVVDNQVADQPIFDLSSNGGTVDGYIADTAGVTNFNVEGLSITSIDLTDNVGLLNLNVGDNLLNSLDVSDNTALTSLSCYINNLSTLDVTLNTALTSLACFENNISTLNVSNNTALTILYCSSNNLSTLDVTLLTSLLELECGNNSISTLNVANNTALTALNCDNNSLSALDVTLNVDLVTLNCSVNTISTIDLSNNVDLTFLDCSDNSLTNLSITNNTLLTIVICDGNSLVSGDIDNIITQLDSNGLSNGTLTIPTGRTAASDAAKTSLQGKGWTVTEI